MRTKLKTKTVQVVTFTISGTTNAEDIGKGEKRKARRCMMQRALRRHPVLAAANYIRVANGRVNIALEGFYWSAVLNDAICARYVNWDDGKLVSPFHWTLKFTRGRKFEQRNQERINAARTARTLFGFPDRKYKPRKRSAGMEGHPA